MFYHPDEVGDAETIEVRLNGRDEQAATFSPPSGWTQHRIQWGDTYFIRRQQVMSEPQIENMLCEVLRFADEHGMRVHSWDTGPNLAPENFQP